MNCRQARNLVQSRHDADLQAAQRDALQAHVDACAACARLARADALSWRWLQELPVAAPSENFDWRLKLRLAALDRPLLLPAPEQPGRVAWLWPFVATTAAAAVLVVAVGLYWSGRREVPAPVVAAGTTPALRPWAPNPGDVAGRLGWPRLVPVRAGAPLGPEVPGTVTASILGGTAVDTAAARARFRSEPIETQPVRYSR